MSGECLSRVYDWEQMTEQLQSLPWVDFAYVFGSVARGQDRPDSDLDLAVKLVPGQSPDREPLLELLSRITAARDRLHPVVLDQATPLLRHRVIRDGRLLFERDPVRRLHFQLDTIREYCDREPLERQFTKALKQSIRGREHDGRPENILQKIDSLKNLLGAAERLPEHS